MHIEQEAAQFCQTVLIYVGSWSTYDGL